MSDFSTDLMTFLQRSEIEKGRQEELSEEELRLFSRQEFNYLQMGVLRSALGSGLSREQVRQIAKPWIASDEMEELVKEMKDGKSPPIPKKPRSVPVLILGAVILSLLGTAVIVITRPETDVPVLTLTSDEIRLACGMTFDPSAYVKEYQGEDARLILPDSFTAKTPEERLVCYELQTRDGTVRKLMRIRIVDETAPEITLSNDHIELLRVTRFSCLAYLVNAKDNVDGDLTDRVECSDTLGEDETQSVEYAVQDRSGNRTVKLLEIHYADGQEETEEPAETPAVKKPVTVAAAPEPAYVPPPPSYEEMSSGTIVEYTETTVESEEVVSSETVVQHSFG